MKSMQFVILEKCSLGMPNPNFAPCRRYDVRALTYCDLKAINVEILVEVQCSYKILRYQ